MIEKLKLKACVVDESGHTDAQVVSKVNEIIDILNKKEEKDHKSITDILEDAKEKMCNDYCKIPYMPVPEGKDGDWLCSDPDSPCMRCPLNML